MLGEQFNELYYLQKLLIFRSFIELLGCASHNHNVLSSRDHCNWWVETLWNIQDHRNGGVRFVKLSRSLCATVAKGGVGSDSWSCNVRDHCDW